MDREIKCEKGSFWDGHKWQKDRNENKDKEGEPRKAVEWDRKKEVMV